ncbi:alpha/beta hydrolase [Halobellus ruber]|uniref:Alpha/beta hydrolase n=1 Tax=Halobellus ruber TaxID=2761102 RepID=A0A7J9SER1_9EURY|nr:alpha/beta hydrolase [Halobellus ruber]MBB6645208.1 alpha/beta hydrolase [Halobellus ruber]
MDEPIFLPGGRDARGTLDVAAADADGAAPPDSGAADACVVACPPHPQHGGGRGDRRLGALSDELGERGVDCLRFDYGPWDGGRSERRDALHGVEWARERYERVALFGYSFGGAVAISAAANGADVVAVAALSPPARVGAAREDGPDDRGGIDTVADLSALPASLPVGIFHGAHDDVTTVGPVADRARERGATVREFSTDHFFVGREAESAAAVGEFLQPVLHSAASR